MYLEKINSPEDVKKLNMEELEKLAEEMRKALMNRLTPDQIVEYIINNI